MSSQKPSNTLGLSDLHRHLDALEKEHQWLLKQIKRKQTELNNFVEQMRSLATEVFQKGSPLFNKMTTLNEEIHGLFVEVLSRPKLGKKARKDIEKIYQNLQMTGIISPILSEEEETADEDLDDLFEEHEQEERSDYFSSDYDENEAPYPRTREETRQIRKTFLKLAEIFHPDKVTDAETQMRHEEVMKEINKAYQDGDMAKLLEIEQKYQAGQVIDINSTDDLTRHCEQLNQHNVLLKNQYDTLLDELKWVKRSPEGAMVSDYRKAKKEGGNLIEQMLEETEEEIKVVEEIRDFVKNFRDKKITLKAFLKGPESIEDEAEDLMDILLSEYFDAPIRVIRF